MYRVLVVLTVHAVDVQPVLDGSVFLLGRLPVQNEAVGFDSGQREGRRQRDFDAENRYQLVGRLAYDLGGAIEDPVSPGALAGVVRRTRRTHQAQATQSRLVPSHVDTNDM